MPRLTAEQRLRIVTLHDEANFEVSQLARDFGVARSTVQRLLAKHRATATTDDRPRPGKPRISTERQDRILIRMSSANPTQVARELRQRWQTEHGVAASTSTVKQRLVDRGLIGRIVVKKPLLSQRHRQTRLQWARERANWTVEQWRRVVFSDESPVHLVATRQRRYVRRRGGAALQLQNVRPTVHSSGGSIMIWGAIRHAGPNTLARVVGRLNAQAYIDLLRNNLLPMNLPNRNQLFQQDNATCHSARTTLRFLEDNHVETLPWPPQSPDLNCIENLWSYVQQQVDQRPVQGLDGLWAAVQDVWQQMPQELVDNLIDSMPRRIEAVINARGGPTKY